MNSETQRALAEEEDCWQAVANKDGKADGLFVYAVLSTRIFCRPSCPARRPKRERVLFFATPQAAADAGFRACKRCRPEQMQSTSAARIKRACRLIAAHHEAHRQTHRQAACGAPLSLDELGRRVGSSASHLQRTFKSATGISPREYSDALRLEQFKANLQNGQPVTSALFDAGYGSSRSLYEHAAGQLGMTPATYRRGGAGARIRFAIVACRLGFLLIAATEKGICAVSLGDSEAELEAALRKEFPAAEISRDEEQLRTWLHIVLDSLENPGAHLAGLPLDIQGTAFQWRVWRELQKVAFGKTSSYTQIARNIGKPRAVRAVARACASNPVALVVPCHRVVRSNGSLSGYRWGLARKQKLLEREKQMDNNISE